MPNDAELTKKVRDILGHNVFRAAGLKLNKPLLDQDAEDIAVFIHAEVERELKGFAEACKAKGQPSGDYEDSVINGLQGIPMPVWVDTKDIDSILAERLEGKGG